MTPPDVMRAVEIAPGGGGPEALRLVDRPTPRPAAGEVLIAVDAAGVNRPDVMQRQGLYPPPPGASDIPGLEAAGRIVAVGDGAPPSRVGEEVCALLSGGGYAEYAVAANDLALPRPAGLSAVDAAAIVETGFTVWDNLFIRGRLRRDEAVLIHGGAGGIGATAIQLAKAEGARVATTAAGPEKCAFCRRLGADVAIDYRADPFADRIAEWTGGRGVDVVLDMIGAPYFDDNFKCLATEGRLVSIAVMGGRQAAYDIFKLMLKRATLTGSTLRGRSLADKAALARAVAERVWPHFADGRIDPCVSATFSLADAADAHRRLESGDNRGKIVLTTR